MSQFAVLMATAALFLACAMATTGIVALAVRLWSATGGPSMTRRSALRAAILAAPPVVATLVCIAVLSAATLGGCHCSYHHLHHPHLCLAHPVFALPLLQGASLFVAVWTAFAAPRIVVLGRALIASTRWKIAVQKIQPRWVDGIAVRLVDCSTRGAFTIGVLSPVIVFDCDLWTELTPEQRRIVVHHEQAHAARSDGLTLVALRMCAALFPHAMTTHLIEHWSAATEFSCDNHAARQVGDRTAVAEALVAVERLRSCVPLAGPNRFVTAMAVAAPGSLEQRVTSLLVSTPNSEKRSTLTNDLGAVALVVAGIALATWMWPGDTVHHAVETVLGLLSPLL